MNRLILLLVAMAISICGFSQVHFLTERPTMKQVRELENSLNSIFVGIETTRVSENFFPGAVSDRDYYLAEFKRTNDTFFPELFVEYYFNENCPDSTLFSVRHNWDIMNYIENVFDDGHHFKTELQRQDDYLQKYNEIKSQVISLLGNPDKIVEDKNADGHFYRVEWEQENLYALLTLSFSTKLRTLELQRGNAYVGAFNIRFQVNYK